MKYDYSKIDPELQQVAKKVPKITFNRWTVWLINFVMAWMPMLKKPKGILVENVYIDGQPDNTKVRLRIYKPKSAAGPMPVLIWLHGGGYVIGNPEMDDDRYAQYVRELGITVVSVDYRLAPKHPFPAALDDSFAALKWVATHANQLEVDASRIAIGGGSAGGGLTAALTQLAYDRQKIVPIFQLLLYPMLDDSSSITSTKKNIQFGWESYLTKKCGADQVPNYSVPARRLDLSDLPPAWIGIGSLDIFHDEGMAYAQRLKTCGVECETKVVPNAFHSFDDFDTQIPLVQAFRRAQISALKKYIFLC